MQITNETALNKLQYILAAAENIPVYNHGLLTGSCGYSIFLFHAGALLGNNMLTSKAEQLIEKMFDDLNGDGKKFSGISYAGGATGFCYAMNYLQKNGFLELDVASEFEDIDEFLYNTAIKQVAEDKIDFLHAAAGVLHYFVSREKSPRILHYINSIAGVLCNRAQFLNNGLWFRNLGLQRLKNNELDLGLAHGQTGILLILMEAWAFLEKQNSIKEIIDKAIYLILQCRMPENYREGIRSLFPFGFHVNDNQTENINIYNRLAWCYGDLNEVLVLYRAGKLFDNKYYLEEADQIGHKTVQRKSEEETNYHKTMFCHGTSGLAQFYKCLYNETANDVYFDSYSSWINSTLLQIDESGDSAVAENNIGLLEGISGTGMVLSEYAAEKKMSWAGIFLL